ncbi:complement C3-like isoform X2 [Cololabis saira]|uniref:complement C3-like isoform X2 n=1 Tax=Cololabis saira TaxID=129043 RepID=UPI002AD32E67|nr:complement C3-like isoform X2 [Cololabis saira]
MGLDRRTKGTQLWLLNSLAFVFSVSLTDGSPMKVMSAPNLLRVGTPENIFLECQDCPQSNFTVTIAAMNYPTKAQRLAFTTVTLNTANQFQEFGKITIPSGDFSQDPNSKQYVYLQAYFPDVTLEKVVLVSFQSGYIFIQTDKTLYTPNSKVYYRVFALTPRMEPVDRTTSNQMDASIAIDFLTPEGIILAQDLVSLKSGMYSGDFKLAEVVSVGVWKIRVKFRSIPHMKYSTQFEVKDYVLPSFDVTLMHQRSFFFVDSEELHIDIKATYLFGEPVDGSAYGVFGVLHQDQKQSFPSSLQRVLIEEGEGAMTLKRQHITQIFENITDLVGSSIFLIVTVLTDNGSEMVEAELRGIQVVTSPYSINFKKTPKYFKAGMSFDVLVEVTHPDDTPAQGVAVVTDAQGVQGVTSANGMARLSINTMENLQTLTITAKTKDPRYSSERQASASMTALPYSSNSNSYIHIGLSTAEARVGENLKMDLILNKQENQENDITYLILSRGQLVKYGRFKVQRQVIISIIVPITKEMLPSFRIIAYYHPNDKEVVSDSVWVDVKDSCMGSLTLTPLRPTPVYEPRKMFALKITGDPKATVGLAAVDKGVFVLSNKRRLTQKKVWDTVEKHDTGCTPGGGKNSMSVFYDAGLLFESNIASGTPYRLELKCLPSSRKKRATAMMNVTTSLLSQYGNEEERTCCLDGMRDTPVSYTCERRSEYIAAGPACVIAFLHCCRETERQRAERREGNLQLARSDEDDNSYTDVNDIVSRSKFPASWLWSDVTLPACPQEKPNCQTTSLTKSFPLQDAITTWHFTGISLSRTHGICIADPLEIIVNKKFFIDLRLPSSTVRGEQIEIKAVLHNYTPDPVTVQVHLIEESHVCSVASKRGKYRQEVKVGPKSTRSLPFVVIPMKEGEFSIEVKAAVLDSSLSDGIIKIMRVLPEGFLVKYRQTISLDPENKGEDGKQVEHINSKISLLDILPNTPTSTQIAVTGKHPGEELTNTIDGGPMTSLIYEPSGCGEENMIHMTMPVIAATYLDKTNQWDAVGIDRRYEVLQLIRTGFQNQLAYRKKDGSFGGYLARPSSTWLTAYVVKVFAMAYNLVGVQRSVICDAVKFLILKTQQPSGLFEEVGGVSNREMMGGVESTESDASMTAFCLIAMQESRTTCAATLRSLQGHMDRAVAYLVKRLPSLVNPYAITMASYALANENKLNLEILHRFASPDLSHWPVPQGRVYTVEATAYALLALVKSRAFKEAAPVVRWLNKQQREQGSYGSTQATLTVYQAVAEYWTSDKDADYNLNVDILLPGRSKPDKYNINRENHYATRTSKVNDINQDVQVTATGPGGATVTMVSLYYTLPKEKDSDCQKFNLSVQLIPEKIGEDEKIYKLHIEVLYKDRYHDATMSALDIALLTGFTANTKDLNLLSKGQARTIAKYKENNSETERSSLVIYLDKVSHTQPEQITFRIHQKLKVGVLQPAAVSVYEFNSHQESNESHCVKFYHPERTGGQLLRLCRDDECTCAEENCSMQKKGNIDNGDRTAKICETQVNSRTDFAYKVRLNEFTDGLSTDIYTMQVLHAIKEGSSDVGPQEKQRIFLSYRHCREALALATGKTYLVMGTSRDIFTDENSQSMCLVRGRGSSTGPQRQSVKPQNTNLLV